MIKHGEVLLLANTPVAGFEMAEESQVDVVGEFATLATVVVGFYAVDSGVSVGIEVNADEDGIGVFISNFCALGEGDECVVTSGHGDGNALGFE